jgi:hypothetical protein
MNGIGHDSAVESSAAEHESDEGEEGQGNDNWE